jgi:hypothetical protein
MGFARRAFVLLLVSLASSLAGVRGAFEVRAAANCSMGCCDGTPAAGCCVVDESRPRLASGCGCCESGDGALLVQVTGLDWSPVHDEPLTFAQPVERPSKGSEPLPASRVPSPEAPPPRA